METICFRSSVLQIFIVDFEKMRNAKNIKFRLLAGDLRKSSFLNHKFLWKPYAILIGYILLLFLLLTSFFTRSCLF